MQEYWGSDCEFTPPKFVDDHTKLSNWLLEWFGQKKETDKAVTIMFLYHMWLARNATRDGKQVENARAVVNRIWALLDEWVMIHAPVARPNRSSINTPWNPPELD